MPWLFLFSIFVKRRKTTLKRNNGRTRERLLIDAPAPRPCSAVSIAPLSSNRGSLGVSTTYSSFHSFYNIDLIIAILQGFCQ